MSEPMTCEACRPLLSAYVDNELDLEAAGRIAAHLEGCEACRREAEALGALKAGVREAAPYYAAPRDLAVRVRGELGKASAATPVRAPSGLWARLWGQGLPLAGGVALAAALALVLVRAPAPELVADEAVSSHVRSLMADHLYDVASSDKHTVKPWFDGKVDFAPQVIDLAGKGYPLVGGRLDYIGHHAAAALLYRRAKHVINLFEWPEAGPGAAAAASERRGYNVVSWRADHLRYVAVSDLNAQELGVFGAKIRTAAGK